MQLTARGAIADLSAAPPFAVEFAARHCVRIPSFIPGPFLSRIQSAVDAAAFAERTHAEIATELCMAANTCLGMLHFLVNDPAIFRFVEAVTGERGLRNFGGRVYRRLPGAHHDSWHSDLVRDRAVGMSVNLSRDRYDGGLFEIRRQDAGVLSGSIANVGFGDAILFRLADGFEHRVTDVTGDAPKTAFAGWFGRTLDYLEALRRDPYLREDT